MTTIYVRTPSCDDWNEYATVSTSDADAVVSLVLLHHPYGTTVMTG